MTPILTGKQHYVLRNLERVVPFPFKLVTRSTTARYQLDGRDCTAQITGLVVRRCVEKSQSGTLIRTGAPR